MVAVALQPATFLQQQQQQARSGGVLYVSLLPHRLCLQALKVTTMHRRIVPAAHACPPLLVCRFGSSSADLLSTTA
jgi:hypothetical protein